MIISLKLFSLLLLLLCLSTLKFTIAQTQTNPTSIKLNSPTNCSSAQYYDIARLMCMSCPANSATSSLDGKSNYFKNFGKLKKSI